MNPTCFIIIALSASIFCGQQDGHASTVVANVWLPLVTREPKTSRVLPPVFTRHTRNPRSSKGNNNGMLLALGAKRVLGIAGALGGSHTSDHQEQELDTSDRIFQTSCKLSYRHHVLNRHALVLGFRLVTCRLCLPRLASPRRPLNYSCPCSMLSWLKTMVIMPISMMALPRRRMRKKSFDFTGELQKLNEPGASDRRSSVEQLENAFKTPANIDLHNLLAIDAPPEPPMQFIIDQTSSAPSSSENRRPAIPSYPEYPSPIIDLKEPTLLRGSDSLGSDIGLLPQNGPLTGELNIGFKLGAAYLVKHSSTTLSQSRSFPESVLKSILAHAGEIAAQPRPRVNSDCSLRRSAIGNSRASMTSMRARTRSRPASGISSTGFDSFDEVRRGFEFHANRPTFYPPPPAARNTRAYHGHHDSVFSIGLREQPSSEDLSISLSMNVDDTFSLLARDPRRKRAASDASSFYFKAPAQQSQTSRGHRYRESTASITSFYNCNRSYASHRLSKADSSTSLLAHQYTSQGATGGRAAWARHQHEPSTDSILSDFSVPCLGRPGVGDKICIRPRSCSQLDLRISAGA
ncbi:hypothetical protein MIND_01147100 [Mycena indigotica]|uniref:Uncharacterized protein n=1 Tax=Mycena indigotica TaxID=2126181 RepID=A0A8H6VVQ6_9AGAR|nr:uncharacterized protein MIND_01147100 [Mycena indigotica]KAF7293671.1 hypothetical protein MIND_01147100 [Mycena indigotica]